jgi:hypothetical protein
LQTESLQWLRRRWVSFQDHRVGAARLIVDLGARFEAVCSNATGDITTVNTTTLSAGCSAWRSASGSKRASVIGCR